MSTGQRTSDADLAGGCQRYDDPNSINPIWPDSLQCDFVHYEVEDAESRASITAPIVNNNINYGQRFKSNRETRYVGSLNSLRSGDRAYFGWSNVSFKLAAKALSKARTDPWILRDQRGTALPGEVVAVVGASGSGKTSLLNVLGGRIVSMDGHEVTGDFTINGVTVKPDTLGPRVAFVTQEDTLCSTATPREALNFSAKLRLPPSVPDDERKQMVEEAIDILRLQRRTSIGVELITKPSILFLDEPTSGLDSYAAYIVVNILKELALSGCTVLCTIHQPSSEVFHLFDRVLVLSDGRTFYDGTVRNLSTYLDALGLSVPEETNPADHIMFLMQTLDKEKLASICDDYEAWTRNIDFHAVPPGIAAAAARLEGGLRRRQAGLWRQFVALGARDCRTVVRDKGALRARFGVATLLNLLFGMLFLGIGDPTDPDYTVTSHLGALVIIGMSGMMGSSQPVLLLFPSERPRFLHEYATGSFSATAYFFSKLVTELPLGFSTSLLAFLITYWMIGLRGSFILDVLITWLIGLSAASTALLFGCVAKSAQQAVQAAPVVFVPQILFAGLFVQIDQIPVWIRWAQYLCSLRFGMNLYLLNEFGEAACDSAHERECHRLLSAANVDPQLWWAYVLVLVGIFVLFRVLGLLVLMRKARGFALA